MGSACSSSATKSEKDVRHHGNSNRKPSANPRQRGSISAKPGSLHLRVGADGEANTNALIGDDGDVDDQTAERDDENDVTASGDEYDDEDDAEAATADRIIAWLKLSAISLMTAAGAYYVSRKAIRNGADLAERLAADSSRQMSGVEAQQIPAKFSPGCVDCGLKSMKTITSTVQQNASRAAISGSRNLHKAYAAGDDFAPPRIYHNYWAAGEFPSQYYSKSDTIKNYRFTRIFGW